MTNAWQRPPYCDVTVVMAAILDGVISSLATVARQRQLSCDVTVAMDAILDAVIASLTTVHRHNVYIATTDKENMGLRRDDGLACFHGIDRQHISRIQQTNLKAA